MLPDGVKAVVKKGIPIAFANVLLISKGDSAFIAGSVTKEDGSFELQSSNKNMMLKVSSIGYKTIYEELKNYQGKPICLEEDAKILNEVVVKGHRSQYKMTNEGLLTHVDGTVLSKMGTAEDVLKHVPGIIKRGDVYEVLGKGTPLIYINNRKVLDVNELDNLKSSAVKSVEVIQAPGAIYGASVNAVIKIKTIPAKGDGFSFDTRSLYSYNKYSGTILELNTNYRHDGLNLFALFKTTSFLNLVAVHEVTIVELDLHVLEELVSTAYENTVVVATSRSFVHVVFVHIPTHEWKELASVVACEYISTLFVNVSVVALL